MGHTTVMGIGRSAIVNRYDRFLHDGRTRGLLEAILWHGGKATGARTREIALSAAERDLLIRFLESL